MKPVDRIRGEDRRKVRECCRKGRTGLNKMEIMTKEDGKTS